MIFYEFTKKNKEYFHESHYFSWKTRISYGFVHNISHFILPSLPLHFSQNKTKEKTSKKRSRLQYPMKLTSSPNEVSFDAHRSLYTKKPSLHSPQCKLGYIPYWSRVFIEVSSFYPIPTANWRKVRLATPPDFALHALYYQNASISFLNFLLALISFTNSSEDIENSSSRHIP